MFNRTHKELFADKLMDLANLILAALVIGQVIAERINWPGLLLGFVSYIVLLVCAYLCAKGVD